MLDQRMQLLISKEQRRQLESKARESGKSVGQLIREAIDARYGAISREERIRAAREIRQAKGGRYLTVAELHELVSEERLGNFPDVITRKKR